MKKYHHLTFNLGLLLVFTYNIHNHFCQEIEARDFFKLQLIDAEFIPVFSAKLFDIGTGKLLATSDNKGLVTFNTLGVDSLRISRKGYQTAIFRLGDLENLDFPEGGVKRIILRYEQVSLEEMQASGKKGSRILRKGSDSKDAAMALGVVAGFEFGRRMHFDKSKLLTVSANICSNSPDSGTFLLRVYQNFSEGLDTLIFTDSVDFVGSNGKSSIMYLFDRPINIEGDIIITFQLLKCSPEAPKSIYFSTSTLTGATHYRYENEKEWSKFPIADVAILAEYRKRLF